MIALSYCRPVAAASILLTASLFVLATAQEAAAADAKGDLWETTSQMSMEGLPMQLPAKKAKVFAAKSGMERLRIAHEAWAQARERLIAFLTAEHPEWDPSEVRRQASKRLLGGSD